MRVLVCGGRYYQNYYALGDVLDTLEITSIIHGGAEGADTMAGEYAVHREIPVEVFEAEWSRYGKRAGYLRNALMLKEGKPDLVVATPGGTGTAMMVSLAEKAGIKVIHV